MSSKQRFVLLILVAILLVTVVIGGYTYGIICNLSDILQSPAVTSSVDIEGDFSFTMSEGKWSLSNIHLRSVHGEFSSKIIDLLLLFR